MKFYNIDMHISVIADMKRIFESLGHEVDDVSLSDHTWVFNRKKDSIPLLDNGNWMRLSADDMSNQFYDRYKEELKDYDAFIVTYPPPFSLLYKKFDKPIIINVPIRYEWPFSFRAHEWKKFNDYLRSGVDEGRIILVANNITDKIYTEAYVDREVKHIPSYCDYFPEKYTGSKDNFLYYSKSRMPELDQINVKYKPDVLKNHTYADLLSYKGIVHIPYACSYMSIFEQYTANMPLFVPEIDLLLKLYIEGRAFSEILFSRMYNAPPQSPVELSDKRFDPNNYMDLEVIKKLASGSDFYDWGWMPSITQFSSFEHLDELLSKVDPQEISKKMEEDNKIRKSKIHSEWKSIIEKLS